MSRITLIVALLSGAAGNRRPSERRTMMLDLIRRVPLLTVLSVAGCACAPSETLPDAPSDGGRVDGGAGLPSLDSGGAFAVPDVPSPVGPACATVERHTTLLPELEDGQVVLQAHGDHVLLVERPNNPPGPIYTTQLRFYLARLGEPFVRIGEHTFDRNVGLVEAVRFRDGAWDVIVRIFSHEGVLAWLRVSEDGEVTVDEHRGPGTPPLDVIEVFPFGDDYVVLAADASDDDALRRPTWILRVTPDGASDEAVALAPVDLARRQVVAQPALGRVLLLEWNRTIGRPPRIAEVPLAPLAAPDADAWREVDLGHVAREVVAPELFDTPSGLVMSEFSGLVTESTRLRIAWLDASFSIVGRYEIETVVEGVTAIAGTFPTQEIVVTLPDSPDDRWGPGTVFHARARAPGVVSALTPIGRALMVFPPELEVGPDGRVQVLHFDDRLDTEVLCEVSP